MKKRILLSSPLIVLVLLQVWRPDHAQEPEQASSTFYQNVDTPEAVRELLERSCADCHSQRTRWPWYSHIAPVGQWVRHHVDEASQHFSLSRYGEYPDRRQRKIFHELAHEVESGHMPLPSYLWIHKDANLRPSERTLLVNWAKSEAELRDESAGEGDED